MKYLEGTHSPSPWSGRLGGGGGGGLAGWLVGWLAGWSGWLAGWLVGWLAGLGSLVSTNSLELIIFFILFVFFIQ